MKKRLIEYDLPLAEISEQSAREKNIRHGHPSTLHIWWAPPFALCKHRHCPLKQQFTPNKRRKALKEKEL